MFCDNLIKINPVGIYYLKYMKQKITNYSRLDLSSVCNDKHTLVNQIFWSYE